MAASADFDRVERVYQGACKHKERADKLSVVEKVVLNAWGGSGEIGNGGFRWLYHGTFEVQEVADAFEYLGLHEAAAACRSSMTVFPSGVPHPKRDQRFDWVAKHEMEVNAHWEPLNRIVWSADDELERRLAALIREHSEEFPDQHPPNGTDDRQ